MSDTAPRKRVMIDGSSKLTLPKHIKMRHDAERGRWIILAPERLFDPDEIAVEVLKLCDGKHSVKDIVIRLANEYNAPEDEITGDIIAMLQELSDKGVVVAQ